MMLPMKSEHQVLQRTYRYRLYPTARQELALNSQLAFACELYNAALEQRRDAWRRQRRGIGYIAQCRDLTELRAEGVGPPGMSCFAMRDPLRPLDRAFAAFFRRVNAGQKPGYPRFRARRRYNSLTWDGGRLRYGRLALWGIGKARGGCGSHSVPCRGGPVARTNAAGPAGSWPACMSEFATCAGTTPSNWPAR